MWACTNKSEHNINKCKILSISRARSDRLVFNYSLNNGILEVVDNIEYLGTIYQSNFEFDVHVKTVTVKAYKLLGFVQRSFDM